MLFYIHLHLNEIFGSVNNKTFAGITVIVVGDLLQLPPIMGRLVYANYKNNWQNFDLLWRHFKIFELTQFIHQRGNGIFIDLLNNVRIARSQASDFKLLHSKALSTVGAEGHDETHGIFARNTFFNIKNQMLETIKDEMCLVPAIGSLTKNILKNI